MKRAHSKESALQFIAAYETPHAGEYERHLVRLARRWLRFLNSPEPTQGVVDSIVEELEGERPVEYGCGWDDFKARFTEWGLREEWIKPAGLPPGRTGRPQARLRSRATKE